MRILVFGIHPDDIEIGCGATVALAADHSHSVVIADLSDGSASSNGTPEQRANEARLAAAILGVEQRVNLGIPDARIESENPEQLSRVVACLREHRPELALIPDDNDPHPDHVSGGRLIRRALYMAAVHGFEPDAPAWRTRTSLIYPGRFELDAQFIVDVSKTFPKKMQAIEAHKTQFVAEPTSKATPLNAPEFLPSVEARARMYGRRIGCEYGEPFRALDAIGISGLNLFEGR